MRWIAISAVTFSLAGSAYVNRSLGRQLDQRMAELASARADLAKQRIRGDDAISQQEERIERLKDTLADEQGKLEIAESRARAASASGAGALRDGETALDAQIERQRELLLRLQDRLGRLRAQLAQQPDSPRAGDEAGEIDPAARDRREADALLLEIRQQVLTVNGLLDRARDLRETGDPGDLSKARGFEDQARDGKELLAQLREQRHELMSTTHTRTVSQPKLSPARIANLRRAEDALSARYEMERQGYTELLSRQQAEGSRRELVQAAVTRLVSEYRNQQLRVERLAQDLEQQERRLSILKGA